MKRFAICFVALASVLTATAQVPAASNPVCAECGGGEMAKRNGEWVEVTPHKSWCPIAKKIEEAKEKEKENAWAPNFNSIEYKYGNGVKCEECGRVQGHVSDCSIGFCQKKILKLSELDHTKIWAGSVEATKNTVHRLEGNIRNAAQRAREERAQAQQGGKSQQPISTKLKDHQPMPEQRPARPEKPTALIPKMDKMPPTVLPNTTVLVGLREQVNGSSTIYDKRTQFNDKYAAVARCHTNANGTEEWALFKDDEKIGDFSKVTVIDEGDLYRFYVCRDMNGRWGLYNKYGTKTLDHEYSSIEPIVFNSITNRREVTLKCYRDGKCGMTDPIFPKPVVCEYDDILHETDNSYRVQKDGKWGLITSYGRTEIPVEQAYIERIQYQGVPNTYYIVTKDKVNFCVYSSGSKSFKDDYTLGEAREKVREMASIFLKY